MLREAALKVLVDAGGNVIAPLADVVVRREAYRCVADKLALGIEVRHLHVLLGRAAVVLEHLEAQRLVVLGARGVFALGPDRDDRREARESVGEELPRPLRVLRVARLGRELLEEVRQKELALHHVRRVWIVLQGLLEYEAPLRDRVGALLGLLELAVLLGLLEQALREAELYEHRLVAVAEALREESHGSIASAVDEPRGAERARLRSRQYALVAIGEDEPVAEIGGKAVFRDEFVDARDRASNGTGYLLRLREEYRAQRAVEDAGMRNRLGQHHLAPTAGEKALDVDRDPVRLVGRVAVCVVDLHEEPLARMHGVALRGPRGVEQRKRAVRDERDGALREDFVAVLHPEAHGVAAVHGEDGRLAVALSAGGIQRLEDALVGVVDRADGEVDDAVEASCAAGLARRLVAGLQLHAAEVAAKPERGVRGHGLPSLGFGALELSLRDGLERKARSRMARARHVVHAHEQRGGDVDGDRVCVVRRLARHRHGVDSVAEDLLHVLVSGALSDRHQL